MSNAVMNRIDELSAAWRAAKMAEDQSRELRIDIEGRIIEELGGAPDEGSKTHTAPNGDKITLAQAITRKVDDERWVDIRDKLPDNLRGVIEAKTSYSVDKTGIEWLKVNEPGYYRLVCQCFTEKPNKISIKIKPMEVE